MVWSVWLTECLNVLSCFFVIQRLFRKIVVVFEAISNMSAAAFVRQVLL
jgi:hypothetical protein